jgi:hypothetical protein
MAECLETKVSVHSSLFQDENMIYRLIYFGGIQPELRKKVSYFVVVFERD